MTGEACYTTQPKGLIAFFGIDLRNGNITVINVLIELLSTSKHVVVFGPLELKTP